MATALNAAPSWPLRGPHQFADHWMFCQLTGFKAHQIALELLDAPLEQSERSLPEHSEQPRWRENDY
jgi:hypothetical protein